MREDNILKDIGMGRAGGRIVTVDGIAIAIDIGIIGTAMAIGTATTMGITVKSRYVR
jgi:hypothetical protein